VLLQSSILRLQSSEFLSDCEEVTTVGLLRPASHAKASLADALLVQLGTLAKPPGRKKIRSRKLKI